jgi:cytidylate kinase
MLITIDGPAGAGKTTVSRQIASRLGYTYVDTGALYRGVAFEVKKKLRSSEYDDISALKEICMQLDFSVKAKDGEMILLSAGVDISRVIRTPEITMLASSVSAKSIVRESLLKMQQELGKKKEVVFEGRDMGTVVFPDADVKFFLDANYKERAKRRYLEISDKISQSLKEVEDDILKRDLNDKSRKLSPLKAAEDAIIIDSTSYDLSEVVDIIFGKIKEVDRLLQSTNLSNFLP